MNDIALSVRLYEIQKILQNIESLLKKSTKSASITITQNEEDIDEIVSAIAAGTREGIKSITENKKAETKEAPRKT